MELEFDKQGISYLNPLLQEIQNQEQTQELRLPDGMPDLGRVIGTWGQVILRSKEWRSDRVSISGGVMAFVLYAPEDGSELRTQESWIPFQMKWALEDGQREGEIRVQTLLRFLDARVVSARKAILRCGIGAQIQAWRQETAVVSIPGDIPGDVQVLKKHYPLRIPKVAGEKTFQMDEELSLADFSREVSKLVSYALEPKVSECRIVSGKLVLRGNAIVHVVYIRETGLLESRNLEVPFSQLLDPEGEFSHDVQCDVRMAVTSLELDMGDQVHLKAGLLAQFLVYDRELVEIVEDAYSTERAVEVRMGELELPQLLDQQQVNIQICQTIRQNSREIADVTYLSDFPVQRRGDGIQLELPGQFQVLFYDENGGLQSTTARTEENWDMPAGENARIHATVLPGVPATASGGSNLELKGESVLDIFAASCRGLPMVTWLMLGEKNIREPSHPSLILRRAGDADLWQIAKSTGSTMDAIRAANGLETEPAPERILLIPVS